MEMIQAPQYMDELKPRLKKWFAHIRSKKFDFWDFIPNLIKSFLDGTLRLITDHRVRNHGLKILKSFIPALAKLRGRELFAETPLTDIISIKLKLSKISAFIVSFYYYILKLIPSKMINYLLSSKIISDIVKEVIDLPTTMPIVRGVINTFVGEVKLTSFKNKKEYEKKKLSGVRINKKFLGGFVEDAFPKKTSPGMKAEGFISVIVAHGVRRDIEPARLPQLMRWMGGADTIIDLMMGPAVWALEMQNIIIPYLKKSLPQSIDSLLKLYGM